MPLEHYWAIFALVLIDQSIGVVPAAPSLAYVGMLLGSGSLELERVIATVLAASLAGHLPWYLAGRRRGMSLLRRFCGYAVQPEACMGRVERLFARWGPLGLIVARFVPGVDILAQILVGVIGMRLAPFLAWTVAGGVVWSAFFLYLGYAFGPRLELVLEPIKQAGGSYLVPLVVALFLLVGLVVVRRHYRTFLGLDVERMGVGALRALLDAGQPVVVFDLRHPMQLKRQPESVPGACRFARGVLMASRQQVPHPPVVMFCNCLHEITSARLAKTLRKEGFDQVFPLEGGLDAWMRAGFPTRPLEPGG